MRLKASALLKDRTYRHRKYYVMTSFWPQPALLDSNIMVALSGDRHQSRRSTRRRNPRIGLKLLLLFVPSALLCDTLPVSSSASFAVDEWAKKSAGAPAVCVGVRNASTHVAVDLTTEHKVACTRGSWVRRANSNNGLSSQPSALTEDIIAANAIGCVAFCSTLAVALPSAIAVVVPVLALIGFCLTVGACYYLQAKDNRLRVTFPAISELGIEEPERLVYRWGFGSVGVLFAVSVLTCTRILQPYLPGAFGDEVLAYGVLAASGCAVQGVFTLDFALSPQTLLHFLGAVMFVFGATNHLVSAREIYLSATGPLRLQDAPAVLKFVETLRFRNLEDIALVLLVVPLVTQFLYAMFGGVVRGDKMDLSTFAQNTLGLNQWLAIFAYAIYFASYAVDSYVVAFSPFEAQ